MDAGRDLYMHKMFRKRYELIYALYLGGHLAHL